MKAVSTLFLALSVCLGFFGFIQGAQAQTGTVDFRKESIYFLLTTRFFDGDPTNNRPTEWCSYGPNSPAITDPNDVTWRGDFKGLIQKLDYIKDLGFTAIWITPIVQNRSPLDYHGYHAWDFTKVDPRLESPGATFQDLVNAVHAKGMKIVLDIVTNHSSRYGIKGVSELKYNTNPAAAWAAPDNPNWSYDGLTPNPVDNKIWSRANIAKLPAPYNSNLANFNFPCTEAFVNTSDINYFHHSGNGFVQGWDDTLNLYQRAIADDCPDLNTGSPVLRNYLVAAYTKFINMGVDGFRWDTMKHMNKGDAFSIMDQWKAINPNLFIMAEVAQKRFDLHSVQEINPHWYTWRGAVGSSANSGMAVLDFYAEATFHTVFQEGQSFNQVQAAARYDNLYSDPSYNVTWLDNHDFGPNNDWNQRYGGTPENLAAAMNFMFTWRGIPSVYYGTECQFMKGAFTDIQGSAGTAQSLNITGRAYFGDQFATAPNSRIYQHIKKLNAIRKAVPALQNGSWTWAGTSDANGVGYTRKSGSSEVAVGLAKDGAVTFNFTGLTNGTYADAVTGAIVNVSNGNLSFTVQPASAGIYVLNGPGMIGDNGAGYFTAGVVSNAPVASMSPAGGTFASATAITLSATGQAAPYKIYYTVDGSTPTSASTLYNAPFTLSANATVKALAVDAQNRQSLVISNSFYIGPQPGFTVYFKKPTTYTGTATNIYYWNTVPATAMPAVTWPGTSMTYNAATGYYSFRFTNTSSTSLIFNDGISQTPDLTRGTDGWYKNGTWYNANPDLANAAPTLTVSPAGPYSGNTSVTVTIAGADDSGIAPTLYYTTDGSTPTTNSPSAAGTKTLTFTATTTLKVFAVDNLGLASGVASNTYAINQAPTLTFSPAGPLTAIVSVAVTVTGADDSGIAPTLYYTTDGTTPTTSSASAAGSKSFTFTSTTTLKVLAVDNQGLASAVQSSTYTVKPNTAPTLTFSPSGPYSGSGSVTVTVTGADDSGIAPTLYYTTDGTTPTTSSPSAVGTKSLTFTATTTLKVFAVDNLGLASAVASNTYTLTAATGFTVYFKKPSNWGTAIKVYYWNLVPSTALPAVTWPGTAMTYNNITGWYSFTFTGATSTNLIFNDGTNQTANLSRTIDGWYTGTTWTNTNPDPAGFTVYFKKPATWGTGVKIYYWNLVPTTALPAVTWPGTAMTLDNTTGWYTFKFTGSTSTSLIFNDGTSQTADQTRNTDGWFYNNAWTATLPAGVRFGEAETTDAAGIRLYPNPAKGYSFIDLSSLAPVPVEIQVRNALGQQVYTLPATGGEVFRLDLSALPVGVYTTVVHGDAVHISKQLVLQGQGF